MAQVGRTMSEINNTRVGVLQNTANFDGFNFRNRASHLGPRPSSNVSNTTQGYVTERSILPIHCGPLNTAVSISGPKRDIR